MKTDEFSIQRLAQDIGSISQDVRRAVKRETGADYDERFIEDSIRTCIANKLDVLEESLFEMFTSPDRKEFAELETILENRKSLSKAAEVKESVQLALKFGDDSIFSGHTSFSKKKLAAMIEYLAGRGYFIYETNLNKLLFYADMSFFYLRDKGISGSIYLNRPFGPVADPAEHTLKDLKFAKRVKVVRRTRHIETDPSIPKPRILGRDEKKVLDWVLETYGKMTAKEISDLSHREKAYMYTDPNDKIAYAYSRFLTLLPPKTLLDYSDGDEVRRLDRSI